MAKTITVRLDEQLEAAMVAYQRETGAALASQTKLALRAWLQGKGYLDKGEPKSGGSQK